MDIYQYQKMMKGRNSNKADAFSGNSFNPLNSYPDRKPVSQYSTGFDNAFGILIVLKIKKKVIYGKKLKK